MTPDVQALLDLIQQFGIWIIFAYLYIQERRDHGLTRQRLESELTATRAAHMADIEGRVDARLAAVKDGEPGKDGMLPVARAWSDAVHYAGAVVTHRGATWQAADTGREPPHADWICLADPGRDGASPEFVGTYDDAGEYRALDVVALNGGSFVALRDAPGPCPGDGWQLVASRGKPGQAIKGDPGKQGEPGRDAAEVVGFYREGDSAVLTFADGREMRA